MTALDYSRIADVYDAYVRLDDDVPFFLNAARATTGRVLELMAGTGRVTLPLVQGGARVTAVDAAPAMLAKLAAKARARGQAPAICCADVRRLPFHGGFALALLPFQGFSELLTEDHQRRALESIRRALDPRGRLVLTLHNPRVRLASVTGGWVEAARAGRAEGGEVVVRLHTAFDRDARLVRGRQRIEEYGPGGELTRSVELPLRFSLPGRTEFQHLALDAGFEVDTLAGDFTGRRFDDATSPLMVWTLARAPRFLGGGWRSAPEPGDTPRVSRSPKGAPPEEEGAYDVGLPGPARTEATSRGGAAPSDVHLAATTRRQVEPDSDLTVYFGAYVDECRAQVAEIIRHESPQAAPLRDLGKCRWREGTEVTVALTARGLEVESGPQTFTWDGRYAVLRFDVVVPADRRPGTVVLKLDVHIAGLQVARLRFDLEVVAAGAGEETATAAARAPRSAFASYASADRKNVMTRIRSLQIATGIDVFFDRLSITPGEKWEDRLRDEISRRDVFWLFWSRHARESKWVDWEWRAALAAKTIDGIQPHPLEPEEVAPPPEELRPLQFGGLYERLLALDSL